MKHTFLKSMKTNWASLITSRGMCSGCNLALVIIVTISLCLLVFTSFLILAHGLCFYLHALHENFKLVSLVLLRLNLGHIFNESILSYLLFLFGIHQVFEVLTWSIVFLCFRFVFSSFNKV
jgi:hypothetical protein